MFDGISFIHAKTDKPITSKHISDETLKSGKYDPENLANSEFYILGSTDSFRPVPVTDFAKANLFYMQAFTIFHYRKGSYTRRQNFHSYLVLYTYEGAAEVEYCGKKMELKPGDGILIDCRKPHYYAASEDWKVAVLHVQGPLGSHYTQQQEKLGQFIFHEGTNGRFHGYLEQLLSIYDSPGLNRELRASHCIDGLLLHILTLTSDSASRRQDVPQSIRTILHYIERHFTEDISLDCLADLTATNKYHLAKEFKRYTGFSPHDYLIWLRINQAKVMLKTTRLPAVKIAHEVGIHDINNFNYLFKKRVGITPIQYRNSADYIL